MTKQTKQRIFLLLDDAFAVSATTFVGGVVTGLTFQVIDHGFQTPDFFGWTGLAILCGALAWTIASCANLIALAAEVIVNRPLRRSVGWMLAAGYVLGSLAVALCFMISPKRVGTGVIWTSGAICAAISAVAAVFRLRHGSRTSPMRDA